MRGPPLAQSLLLIPRRQPVIPGLPPIGGMLGQPFKAIAWHLFKRLAHVVFDISCHTKNRTGLEHTVQRQQMLFCNETAAVVARFGPRIWIEQERFGNACFWQDIKHITDIAGMYFDVVDTCAPELAQQHRNTINIGLAANDAYFRICRRLMHHMLTAAKSDFEPSRLATKHNVQIQHVARWVGFPIDRPRRQRRKVFFEISLLGIFEVMALEATIKVSAGSDRCAHARAFSGEDSALQSLHRIPRVNRTRAISALSPLRQEPNMSPFPNATATPMQTPPFPVQIASILIVDDQRFDRSRLRRMCGSLGFNTHIDEAESLGALRDRLKKDRFDLILLDHHLTDGTGLEGVDIIRADTVNHSAATVMVTGTEQAEVAVQAFKLGISDYLSKEALSLETLRQVAVNAMEKSNPERGGTFKSAKQIRPQDDLRSFSRECARDIKPIVSRMMRQMRELREQDTLTADEAALRVERVEGSMRRLWAFLEDLEQLGAQGLQSAPTVASQRGDGNTRTAQMRLRVPSEQPERAVKKPLKTPSVFRRCPD